MSFAAIRLLIRPRCRFNFACLSPEGESDIIDSSMTVSTKPITADELWAMGDIGRCELIYGQLVMISPAGAEHGMVAVRFARFLADFVDDHQLGVAFPAETGFRLEAD